jgi:transposase-like protein
VQKCRDAKAAKRFFPNLLKSRIKCATRRSVSDYGSVVKLVGSK